MGSLKYIVDTSWLRPPVTLPGSEKWKVIDKHIVANGFVADLSGQQMLYSDVHNHWINLVSSTAALRITQLAGNDNVSTGYDKSFDPYYTRLSKASSNNSSSYTPLSVCIGTRRMIVQVDPSVRTMTLAECDPLVPVRMKSAPDYVYALCYCPADHTNIPSEYVFPGICRILNFLSPLFPDRRSLVTYMWLIGNAARDPIARSRCMLLCGPGGAGKSTALRMATAALSGATNVLPDNILCSTNENAHKRIARTITKSRFVTCYELDLDNKEVNMSTFKNITGGDYVEVDGYMSKSTCSLGIATNGLPDVLRQPEFMSDALSRRVVCIRMDVDTANADYEPDPSDSLHKVDFLCTCVYIRSIYPDLPISPDNLLMTLCGSLYFDAKSLITEVTDRNVTAYEGVQVLHILAGLMKCTVDNVVGRCRLISMSCIVETCLGHALKGLAPTMWQREAVA